MLVYSSPVHKHHGGKNVEDIDDGSKKERVKTDGTERYGLIPRTTMLNFN